MEKSIQETRHFTCATSVYIIFDDVCRGYQKNFQTNLSVHGLDTRNKNQLYLPISSLSCLQKGVSYSAMKIFNSLPNNIKNHRNNRVHFNIVLCKYLTLINFVHLQNYLSIIQIIHTIYILNF
jgi:hypothetical protein